MIYRGFKITANAPDFHYFEVREDGSIGDFIDNGGLNGDYEFDIAELEYPTDDPDDEQWDMVDGGYDTFEQARAGVDALIERQTTIQSEAGN